jgi:hypothetical protein
MNLVFFLKSWPSYVVVLMLLLTKRRVDRFDDDADDAAGRETGDAQGS